MSVKSKQLTKAATAKRVQAAPAVTNRLRGFPGNNTVRTSGRTWIPVHSYATARLQPKLTVNTPGNLYEQEADRVAERVMRMPEQSLQRACACGGGCSRCLHEQDTHEHMQTKSVQANDSVETPVPPVVQQALHSSGQPLDPSTRAFFEPRFGNDFSRVRVHTDSRAQASARAVDSLAYTVGRDVVFGAGQYGPSTSAGRQLLAHELTHVLQQRAGVNLSGGLGQGGDAYERQADAVAARVTQGVSTAPLLGKFPSGLSLGGATTSASFAPALVQFQKVGLDKPDIKTRTGLDPSSNPAARAIEIAKLHAQQPATPPVGAKTAGQKVCGPDVTKWLIRQIETNWKTKVVAQMKKDNEEDWKGVDLGAMATWYELVKTGAQWDFKKDLGAAINLAPCRQKCSGKLYSITLDGQCMTYETPANIHYGYVGRAAGFTEARLLRGASDAQTSEGRGEAKDDPRDVQAIKKGFELFNAGSPAGLNKSGLNQNYYQNLPAGDGDPEGCEPCSTKL